MSRSVEHADRLVEDYLANVADACAGLPLAVRRDLIADLREHIEVARAGLTQPDEAAVRRILDRLGEPAAIAAEARLDAPPPAALRPVRPRASVTAALVLTLILIALLIGTLLVTQTG